MKLITCFLNETITRDELFSKISNLVTQKSEIQHTIVDGLIARENEITTGLGDQIAIPHTSLDSLSEPILVFIRNTIGMNWNSLDNKNVNLVFCILTSKNNPSSHLDIISNISKVLLNDDFKKQLLVSTTYKDVEQILLSKQFTKISNVKNNHYDIVAVTACPSGLAHTFLSRDALINEAEKRNLTIKVETHGANEIENKLTKDDLKYAKKLILAVDKDIDLSQYQHKNIYKTRTIDVVRNPEKCFENTKLNSRKYIYNILYTSTTSASTYLFASIKILGFVLGILCLLKTNISDNNIFYYNWDLVISIIAKLILLLFVGLITYNISKQTEGLIFPFITAIIFGITLNNSSIEIRSISLIEILLISLIWTILLIAIGKLLKKIKFEYLFLKSLTKFVLYLVVIILFVIVKIFIGKYFDYINGYALNWIIYNSNHYWWFNTITIFILANLYILDFGKDINKWTLVLCYLLYTISISFDVNNLWVYPFTVILFAPAIPNFNSSITIFILKNKYDKATLSNAKKTFKDGFRPITESTIPLYKIFKNKLLIADLISVLCGSILIGIFKLKFFGGISSPLGFIFGYVESAYWFYGTSWITMYLASIISGVLTLTLLTICKGEKNVIRQKNV